MKLLVTFFLVVCFSNAREIQICWNYDEGVVEKENSTKTDIAFPVAGALEEDICKIIEECSQDADPTNDTQTIMVPVRIIPQSSNRCNNTDGNEHDEINFITGLELSIWNSMKQQVAKWEAVSNTTVQGICFSMDVSNATTEQAFTQLEEKDDCYLEDECSLLNSLAFNSSSEERNDADLIHQMLNRNSFKVNHENKIKVYKVSHSFSRNVTSDLCTTMEAENTTNQDNTVLNFLYDLYALEKDDENNHPGKTSTNTSNVCTHELLAICEQHNNYTTTRDEKLTDTAVEIRNALVLFELKSCLNNQSTISHYFQCSKEDRIYNSTLDPNFTLHKFFQRSASKIKKECVVPN